MTIQKFAVESETFPLIFSDGSYHIRYRMTTENGLIASDWSDVYQIFVKDVDGLLTTAQFVLGTQELTLNLFPTYDSVGMLVKWDAVQNSDFANIKYDVFVKWSYAESGATYDSNWTNIGEYASSECYVTIPASPRAYWLKARIQIATHDKTINDNVLLIESTSGISTTYVSATGNIDGGVI